MRQKGFAPIIVFVILAVVVGIGIYLLKNGQIRIPASIPNLSSSPTPDPTANWKTYINTQFKFLVKYPPSWEIAQDPNSAPIATSGYLIDSDFELVLLDKTQPLFCGPYECFPSVQFSKPFVDNSKIKLSLQEWVLAFIKTKMPDATINPDTDLKTLVVDKQPAVGFDDSIFVSKNNYVYLINFDFSGASGGRPRVPEQTTFDLILSTFKFLDVESSPSPTSTSTKNLSYKLPGGWSTATDKGNTFSVGYDPVKYDALIYDLRIDLAAKSPGISFFIRSLPYDSGSRHEFIRKNIGATSLGAIKTKNTIEMNYTIAGKNGLFLYNMDLSSSCSIGMVGINKNSALLIESQLCAAESIEPILSTFKFTD